MITFSGTGASGSAQPSNTASLTLPVSDTSAKAPQSGPAKKEVSSRAARTSPYQRPSSYIPFSPSSKRIGDLFVPHLEVRDTGLKTTTPGGPLKSTCPLIKQSDVVDTPSTDSELDDASTALQRYCRSPIPADSRASSSSRGGNQGKTKPPSTSKLIACFEEEVEGSTRPLRDEIAKLKKDNARLDGENRANKVDLRLLRDGTAGLELKVTEMRARLELSEKREADIREAAKTIREWAQSRVEKEYEEAANEKDKAEEKLGSLEEVKKHIEAFGK
ncbi:hypothetical protein EHS25_007666 [Saitozyma podzolica]|uniref:Uncharacterized protein n=1 Tax=Saitozyma podzolica TaxID=1890683 RepID=A0A427YQE2_9TREE|nr:hypothetical protein EHS25_007666 [Saitozyma podzolica]